MLTELRSAVRSLVRNPGLFLLATATLAIGMGAATSIFSAVDAVVLRPLPYRDQDRLVVMWQTDRRTGAPLVEVSYPEFEAWRDRSKSFDGVAAMTSTNFRVNLTGHGEPLQVEGAAVSADFFDVLGAGAALGRMFRPEEDAAGAAPVAILSHSLWQRRFAGDPGVVGTTIIVDGGPATIVGVAGSDVSMPKSADLWFPAGPNIGVGDARQYRILEVVARLREAVSLVGAEADMAVVSRHLQQERPGKNVGLEARIVPLTTFLYGDTRRALSMLLAGVGLLLLIACANVAHLLLARAADREREMALHAALGASRGRLLQRLLLESLCLAGAGAVAGLALAHWATRGLALGIPANVPGASTWPSTWGRWLSPRSWSSPPPSSSGSPRRSVAHVRRLPTSSAMRAAGPPTAPGADGSARRSSFSRSPSLSCSWPARHSLAGASGRFFAWTRVSSPGAWSRRASAFPTGTRRSRCAPPSSSRFSSG